MNRTGPENAALQWLSIAQKLEAERRIPNSVRAFQQAMAIAPGLAVGWYEFGRMLRRHGQGDAAEDAFRRALASGLEASWEVYLEIALVQAELRQDHEGARQSLRTALDLAPGYVPAWLNLGNLAEDRGEREEARSSYRSALSHSAEGSELEAMALARLLDAGIEEMEARTLVRAESALANPGLPRTVRADVGFAIGRWHDREGDPATGFRASAEANRLAGQASPAYSERAAEDALVRLQAALAAMPTPTTPRQHNVPEPLFIVGMFRSGSTLLEQMLAAHTAIGSMGESPFFPAVVARSLQPFPQALSALDEAVVERMRTAYLDSVRRRRDMAPAAYIIDKRPDNLWLLPLVKRVFPSARIIVTRRHPLDNGLSIFQHHLDPRHAPHSTRLDAIGHHIALHDQLVDRCQARFGDDLAIVQYEALVADPAGVLRTLLGWLGLEWQQACLEFHRTAGPVRTASAWQVREPVHGRACGRWRRYARELEPLRDALRRMGVDPAVD
ncbi:MAG TPA: hypothetical protein DCM32_07440 [Xanthomonadaceae bacterium]|nr:hypothetical protein [Xanthomonadaceae bacterium]